MEMRTSFIFLILSLLCSVGRNVQASTFGFVHGMEGAVGHATASTLLGVVGSFGLILALLYLVCRRRSRIGEQRNTAQREFSMRLIRSQEEERKRIAHELHDSLGQDLLLIKTSAQLALAERNAAPNVTARLTQIRSIAAKAVDDVRTITGNLRPPELDRLGLAAALEAMANQISNNSSLEIDCGVARMDHRLAKDDEINVYRIVQECVTNALKHSGANRVQILADRLNGDLNIRVVDDGRGFDPSGCMEGTSSGGLGLIGLAERSRSLGGDLQIESTPQQGTCITLTVPIQDHDGTTRS